MKKNSALIVLSLVLSLSIVTETIICARRNKIYTEEIAIKDSLISSFVIAQSRLDYLQHCVSIEHKYGGVILDNQIAMDTVKTANSLVQIAADAPILVFRFKEGQCQNCISFGMLKLETFSKDSTIKTAVFANYNDFHSFKITNRAVNGKSLPIYNVKDLGALDQLDVPYFFILEKDLSARDVFIPEKVLPDITNHYFEAIRHKLKYNRQ